MKNGRKDLKAVHCGVSFAPPYALTPTTFRFRALAALAGRAPLGGGRETALASYVVARLDSHRRGVGLVEERLEAHRRLVGRAVVAKAQAVGLARRLWDRIAAFSHRWPP